MKLQDALTSLDEHGHRKGIIPAEVKGFWKKNKEVVHFILIFFFLLLPWTKINGIQTVLLDLPNRTFALFGTMFWAHDGPLLFFVFAVLVFSLAAVTAIFGRVWCGWACPQTVFIEGVYRRIEIWIEGNYLERRKLRDAPMSGNKFFKLFLKWLAFFLVSSLIAHSFVAYFTGAEKLVGMMQGSPTENWTYFLVISFITGVLLFDFGWFREQFCVIMCPYGRFQSVLLDRNSLTVMYDEKRGEPRKGLPSENGKQGDCVSCNRCVQVCPTGIDIRKGIQMECIGCTACIDACDEIMTKVNKPKGLIGYKSISGRGVAWKRPRVLAYAFVILIGLSGIFYNFFARAPLMVTLLRAKDTPYQLVEMDGIPKVINHFKVHIHNQTFSNHQYSLVHPEDWDQKNVKLTLAQNIVTVARGDEKILHFFVIVPADLFDQKGEWVSELKVQQLESPHFIKKEMRFVGPAR